MKICVLDAWHPESPALVNSHWVAEQTIDALHRHVPAATLEVLEGDAADAARVEAELAQPHAGFAYFGHGRWRVLYRLIDSSGAPIPLLGVEQVRLIGDRWFHAFACLSGDTLAKDAAAAGAAAYLGYSVPVNVNWDVPQFPDELHALVADLVTVATLRLAQGERSRGQIRRDVRAASDRLLDWMDRNPDAYAAMDTGGLMGLHVLANLLHQDLELEGTAVRP